MAGMEEADRFNGGMEPCESVWHLWVIERWCGRTAGELITRLLPDLALGIGLQVSLATAGRGGNLRNFKEKPRFLLL